MKQKYYKMKWYCKMKTKNNPLQNSHMKFVRAKTITLKK